jgi:plasmid stabilization system protein ParE
VAIRVQEAASLRLDEIYRYTRVRWGAEQADRYITEPFAAFDQIESHGVASRPISAEFGVEGFYFRHAHHFVYWRRLSNGDVGIVERAIDAVPGRIVAGWADVRL